MHRIFQQFIDLLSRAGDAQDLSRALAQATAELDLSCFAYLALPDNPQGRPYLISTYPSNWTSHYLRSNYQAIDPVIVEALQTAEPFRWGVDLQSRFSSMAQQQLLDEAAQCGLRFGFTVPIHDSHGPPAALTFATDRRRASFEGCVNSHARVLQLMGILFHAHARRTLTRPRRVNGIELSTRERECLEWATQGKSAWEIGQILGISQYTAATHLSNAKKKLGVRTVVQAAIHFAAGRREKQN
ncbi:LuxR family transcriptional regulator [Bradyrhizobium sp. USDA 3256]